MATAVVVEPAVVEAAAVVDDSAFAAIDTPFARPHHSHSPVPFHVEYSAEPDCPVHPACSSSAEAVVVAVGSSHMARSLHPVALVVPK